MKNIKEEIKDGLSFEVPRPFQRMQFNRSGWSITTRLRKDRRSLGIFMMPYCMATLLWELSDGEFLIES